MDASLSFIVIIGTAVLATMAFSAFWYAPQIFGNSWMALSGVNPVASRDGRKMMLFTFFANIATALTLYIVLLWAGAQTAKDGLVVGVWIGSGLTSMTLLISYLWEGKPMKLFLIVAGNSFCCVVLMATLMAHLMGKFYF